MRQDRAFGPAGGSTGVEEPGRINRFSVKQRFGVNPDQLLVFRTVDCDDIGQHPGCVAQWADRVFQITVDDAEPGARILDDIADFSLVKLGVQGHGY